MEGFRGTEDRERPSARFTSEAAAVSEAERGKADDGEEQKPSLALLAANKREEGVEEKNED